MSYSKIIQLFHLVNHRVQCKKFIFIFIFISILLTLHLFFYFYFSKSYINSSHLPRTSFEESIFVPIVVYVLISIISLFIPGDIIYVWRKTRITFIFLTRPWK
ncbi:hypothetical protein RhiirA4_67400 [Rhizophagus irregularis]|uniref:Uncharacterized protein n=1 Tax=Rhizophagus irregularis TaxID=588596 RepID=A0A2I1H7R1_9GLOM|nr:hypothetical protein RhiirA4_67400 [Rhizophagus irregularis]